MADPTAYTISYSFTDYQTASPSDPLPAANIDVEYANISTALASLRASLMNVRRSDGALTNGIVTKDSLAADLKIALLVASDLLVPTVSTTGLTYVYGDLAGVLSKHEPLALMTNELVAAPVATTGAAYVYAESAGGAVVKHEPGALMAVEFAAATVASADVSYTIGLDASNALARLPAAAITINRTTEGDFWGSAYLSPLIHRMRDRVFIGNATGMGSTRTNTNTTFVDATATGANWIPRDSQAISMSDNGGIALAGGARVSDGDAIASRPASIGVAGFIINDGTISSSAWALYADVQHQPTAGANSYGLEVAAKNKDANTTATPYDRTSGVYGIWLAGGGDATYGGAPTYASNVGVMFIKSNNALTSGWNVGINFDDESLTYTSGTAPAIRMAKGHAIEWFAPDGALGARIYSTVDAGTADVYQVFDDDKITFYGSNDAKIIEFQKNGTAVNNLLMYNSATGANVQITVDGSDTNAGISVKAKGTGSVYLVSGASGARIEVNNTGLGFFATTPVAAKTGWAVATGTATRTTFATSTVTTAELAERVKALIDDLHQTAGYGLLRT